ncbi:MAG TPA: NADH-quinone oxidoreductase subunit NuoH [Campylobacterales bacterium]|nr:NADH-quinone oxidoreductase subunit NuoH [Campylobacterales bacterium]HIO71180.1 NADH-quinone oxidoreductase subunit NuoH [Campylobacterales bacterium]
MDLGIFIFQTLIKILLVLLIFSALAGFTTYIERKVLAFMQRRLGPMYVGPFGLLQILADGIKLFTKEDIIPTNAIKPIFKVAPVILPVSAFVAFTGVPILPDIQIGDTTFQFLIVDSDVGVLFVLGVMAVGMFSPLLAGIASSNKWSLLGGARTAIQLLSFEVVTGLSILAPLMLVGSLNLIDINNYQIEHGWLIWQQPIAFVLFLIAGYAETNRTPFDLLEHEAEVVSGYATEYSGMRWGLFFIGEYVNMYIVSFLVVLIFLGGFGEGTLLDGLCYLAKVLFFIFLFLWTRAAWPHVRPDQLMWLTWKVLMPLAVINIVVTGLLVI